MDSKKHKLVYLEWADAHTNAGWMTPEQIDTWKECEWYICEAGWLIDETDKFIVIAEGWKKPDEWTEEQFVNLHKIPKTWIRKRKILHVK